MQLHVLVILQATSSDLCLASNTECDSDAWHILCPLFSVAAAAALSATAALLARWDRQASKQAAVSFDEAKEDKKRVGRRSDFVADRRFLSCTECSGVAFSLRLWLCALHIKRFFPTVLPVHGPSVRPSVMDGLSQEAASSFYRKRRKMAAEQTA